MGLHTSTGHMLGSIKVNAKTPEMTECMDTSLSEVPTKQVNEIKR